MIVEGQIDFNGTSQNNQVKFISDRPASPQAGDWWGIRVESYPPSGGDCADTRDLDFTLIRDAVYGIALADTCSFNINWPVFSNNLKADIYLDRDVKIPADDTWDLRAPTSVVAEADTSLLDIYPGQSELVDLIVRGTLVTQRPAGAQSSGRCR